MRSNHSSSNAVHRNAGERNLMAHLSMSPMPAEWLQSGSWRLPSGKALAEFALQAGFLAPLLLRADANGSSGAMGSSQGSPKVRHSATKPQSKGGRR